jgi:hypothetical protein
MDLNSHDFKLIKIILSMVKSNIYKTDIKTKYNYHADLNFYLSEKEKNVLDNLIDKL